MAYIEDARDVVTAVAYQIRWYGIRYDIEWSVQVAPAKVASIGLSLLPCVGALQSGPSDLGNRVVRVPHNTWLPLGFNSDSGSNLNVVRISIAWCGSCWQLKPGY